MCASNLFNIEHLGQCTRMNINEPKTTGQTTIVNSQPIFTMNASQRRHLISHVQKNESTNLRGKEWSKIQKEISTYIYTSYRDAKGSAIERIYETLKYHIERMLRAFTIFMPHRKFSILPSNGWSETVSSHFFFSLFGKLNTISKMLSKMGCLKHVHTTTHAQTLPHTGTQTLTDIHSHTERHVRSEREKSTHILCCTEILK